MAVEEGLNRTIGTRYPVCKTQGAPRVEMPGLPKKNVVPVYPITTNINAMLPNDEKFHVAHSQVKVLINFSMTDFASQGKTRPWNVCDLNNLRSHQSYYMALSRSATAEGTLILQGFDPL